MKTVLLQITFLISIPFIGSAQTAGQVGNNTGGYGTQGNVSAISMYSRSMDKDKAKQYFSDEFAGTPYTDNNFQEATLFYNEENQGTVYYRYNAFNEEVEIRKTKSNLENIRGLSTDKAIRIKKEDGKILSFKTFIDKNKNTLNGYLTGLYDGETYDLYKRIKVKFTPAQAAQNSFVKATPNRFSQFTEYYLQKKGVNKIEEITPRNNRLLRMVDSDKKKELKDFLKSNDLNIKNEADLIKAVEFLNQI